MKSVSDHNAVIQRAVPAGSLPLFILILLSLSAGCGSSSSNATVIRSTVGDTLVVATTPPVEPGPSIFMPELDLTIGAPDGPDEYLLMRPTSVSADADGNIHVSDQSDGEVRIYDRSGRHLRSFGRRGDGPGEFNSNYWGWFRVRDVSGDRLTVEDLPRLRIFDSSGQYLSTFDLMLLQSQDDREHTSTIGIEWFPERETIIARWSWNLPDQMNGETLVLLDEALVTQQEMPGCEYTIGFYQDEDMGFSLPHSQNYEWTTSGGRLLAWGVSGEYRIDMYDLESGRWSRALLDIPAEPVTAADIQAFKDDFLDREWMRGQEGLWEPLLNRARYPEVKPYYGDMLGDDRGRIWVRRYSEISGPDEPEWYRYDLFNGEAEWLGIVDSPVTFEYIRDGSGYRLDYEEYPVVERYRLIPNTASDRPGDRL